MKHFALVLALAVSAFAAPAATPAKSTPSAARMACAPALHDQMQLDNAAAQQWSRTSYMKGVLEGGLLGAGGTLFLVGMLFQARKRKQSTPEPQTLTRAASV